MESMERSGPGDGDATRRLDTVTPGGRVDGGSGALAPGARVGRSRIVERIGSGGMGTVYRAEQLEPVRRTVALKVLRGRLGARQRAYFEIERQTLAQMQHPGIAQILDGGTTDEGVPWFAMEYIEGRPVTEVGRDMPLDERLSLMARVCDAIQHAHQKGVVHRDLKPANILVTRVDGQWLPKIIDFGIATAAARAGRGGHDRAGSAVDQAGTPDYMSPEQLEGRLANIDTRSDVYALGVVLYELVVGERPFAPGQSGRTTGPATRTTTLTAPSQRLRQGVQDRRLSGLRRGRLRELDQVVLTAMAHERDDRYPSAAALADELRRFLAHQPLQAMPARPAYLLAKFAHRHRLLLVAAGAVAGALVVGLVASLHAYRQAETQRAVAQARQRELEQVVAFQQSMLGGIDVREMGVRLLELEREQVQRTGDPALAGAFQRVAGVLDGPALARSIVVETVLRRAERTLEESFAQEPALAADLRGAVGEVYLAVGDYQGAVAAFEAVLAARESVAGTDARASLEARVALANALDRAGRYDRAQEVVQPALEHLESLPADDILRVTAPMTRAQIARSRLEYGIAREWYGRALEAVLDIHPPDHPEVLRVRQQYALALHLDGATDLARPQFEEVLALLRQRGDDWQPLVAALTNYAAMLSGIGEGRAAMALEREAYAIQREHVGADHPLTLMILNNLGLSMLDHGDDPQEALALLIEAAEGRSRMLGPENPQTLRSLASQARGLDRVGRTAEAIALYRHVYGTRQRVLGPASPDTLRAGYSLADILSRSGQGRDALDLLRQMRDHVAAAGGDLAAAGVDTAIAGTMAGQGDADGAMEFLRQRLHALIAGGHADGPERHEVALALYRICRDSGRREDAAQVFAQHLQPLLERDEADLAPALRRVRSDVLKEDIATDPSP